MAGSLVVDASVAAKLYFTEEQSDEAEAAIRAAESLIAPELLFIELASIAAKQVRRGIVAPAIAASAMDLMRDLLDEAVPLSGLAKRAFELAVSSGVSAYDGAYLALADARGLRVLTADYRLVRRAETNDLSHLVRPLVA